ncbi:hypothetical protein LXA43DRAFT_947637 [Ganoderma leucocontextum]|nr:hypothetical protein LXA43DRAFT_947637 [Ganoderma leucocontextum]
MVLDPQQAGVYTFYHPSVSFPYSVVVHNTEPNPNVDSLWAQAKQEDHNLATYFQSTSCTFYVPSDLPSYPAVTLLSRSREWLAQRRDDGEVIVNVINVVRNIFPNEPTVGMIHFLVVTEDVLESMNTVANAVVEKALRQRELRAESSRTAIPSPSFGVSGFQGIQQVVVNHADKFHAGRPATNYGLPAPLFNPHLGLLDHHLHHLDDEFPEIDPPPDLFRLVHTFMTIVAESYPAEDDRRIAIQCPLSDIFATPLGWDPSVSQFKIITDVVSDCNTPCLVVQIKNEVGLGGDASLQLGLSYVHIVTGPRFKDIRELSNCPSVLVGIMGDLLEVGVAIYTDGPYYNRLFSERMHLGYYVEKNLFRLTRALMATRIAISRLMQYYAELKASPPATRTIAHLFPSPLPVPSYEGFVPSLTFTSRLSRSGQPFLLAEDEAQRQTGIYLATMPRLSSAGDGTVSLDAPADRVEVVVKFTARYNEDAHRLLAIHHLAPELHACIPVCGDLFMVVMDRVHGEMALEVERRGELLPSSIYEEVRDAIALLHSNDLVFGDLRTPNIMVVPGGSSGRDRPRSMLLDFDWVGTHGHGRYPASLNDGLPDWATSNIRRCGIMAKADDLAMLEEFRRQCRST